ncbi:MAG TPA: hypothetical protein VF043_19050 [Ktedonobacteraceae bacterium]
MTYYRLALQDRQTATWIWKTTALTSLQAVFQLLRTYGKLPQGSIRVFTASSKEDLNEMLRRQNTNLASSSVTAAQFLQERNIAVPESAQSASRQRISSQADQQGATVAAWAKDVWDMHAATSTAQVARQASTVATSSSLPGSITTTGVPVISGMSSLDKKRLEVERGQGGDHDTPYRFTLPISMPQLLAWTRLQTRVQAGELPS